MTLYKPGDDVLVDFEGTDDWWPAEVLRSESSGYVICRAHIDPLHDFGSSGPRISAEQTLAVRIGHVRRVEEQKG